MALPTRRPRFLQDADAHIPSRFNFSRFKDERLASSNDAPSVREEALPAPTPSEETEARPQNELPEMPVVNPSLHEQVTVAPGMDAGEVAPTVLETPPVEEAVEPAPVEVSVPRELDMRLIAAIESLRLRSERMAEEARADALEIGFMVARKILERELSTNPNALFELVRAAVRAVGETRKVILRLHPGDCARLENSQENQRHALTLAKIEFVADSDLAPGDCLVEGDLGQVDGRLSTRLAELARNIEQAVLEDTP